MVEFVCFQVKIYPDTEVYCEKLMWAKAKQSNSGSQFVRALLVGVFSTETLLASTLRGGVNKRDADAQVLKPLDDTLL